MPDYIIFLIVFFIHSNCPDLLEDLNQQHPSFHALISDEHFLFLPWLIDRLWLAWIWSWWSEVLNILINQDLLLVIKISPDVLLPFLVAFGLKLLDLACIGADLYQPIIFSRNFLHIFGQGNDLSCFSGILLQTLVLIFPKTFIKRAKLKTNVIINLVFGGDL